MRWVALAIAVLALILIPFVLFEPWFNALAARLARGQASTWFTVLAMVGLLGSDVVLPIPSSIVSAGAGMLLGFWSAVAVIWVGMTISCLVGYLIGATSASAAKRFVGNDGLTRASALAESYGDMMIVVSRPVPGLAEASIIFAGVVGTPFARFFVMTSSANLGIALGYAAIGAFSMQVESFLVALVGALAVPGLAMLAARLWLGPTRRRRDRSGQNSPNRQQ